MTNSQSSDRAALADKKASAISLYVRDWARIIYDATGDQTKVDRAIQLADLNGMFDPVKVTSLYARSSSPYSGAAGEAVAWRYRWAEGQEWEDIVMSEDMLPTNRDGWIIEPLFAHPTTLPRDAERETIERCAKVAEGDIYSEPSDVAERSYNDGRLDVAAAIRALPSIPPREGN